MLKLNSNKLNTRLILSKDAFATTFPYQKDSNDRRWAIKVYKTTDLSTLIKITQNIATSTNLEHPAILSIKSFHVEQTANKEASLFKIYMKTPRTSSSLLDTIREHENRNVQLPIDRLQKYSASLIDGIEFLHSKHIPHGNLCPQNILLNDQDDLKLADFGKAAASYKSRSIGEERSFYRSPEELSAQDKVLTKQERYRADLWSLGVVLLELFLCRSHLIKADLEVEVKKELVRQHLADVRNEYNQELADCLSELLSFDPLQRGGVDKLKECIKHENTFVRVTKLVRKIHNPKRKKGFKPPPKS